MADGEGFSFLSQEDAQYLLHETQLDLNEIPWSGEFSQVPKKYPLPKEHSIEATDIVYVVALHPNVLRIRKLKAHAHLVIVGVSIGTALAVAQLKIMGYM